MFTGIVEDLGEVEAVERAGDSARVFIRSDKVTHGTRPGDSIAVNGVCLTVTGLLSGLPAAEGTPPDAPGAIRGFTADVMGETLARSSLAGVVPGTKVNLERSVRLEDRLGGHLVQGHVDGTAAIIGRQPQEHWDVVPGTKVNLERPVRLEDRLGGHLVQGHVDGTAAIIRRQPQEHWEVVRIGLPPGLARYVVHKGSIAVDGISLTVSGVGDDWFEVSLIPETLKRTTLGAKQPGETVNLEVDVIAKYVQKLLGGAQ